MGPASERMKNDVLHREATTYQIGIYAVYAVAAHMLLGLAGTLASNLLFPRYSWSYILHVLTSPKLYASVALYGGVAWVGLVVLTQMVRWFFHRRWVQNTVIMLVVCYWRPALSLLAWVLIGVPFAWQQLVVFPLVFGWSPAILLWLIYRKEKQLEREESAREH